MLEGQRASICGEDCDAYDGSSHIFQLMRGWDAKETGQSVITVIL
jgi:hypothetical protein